MNNENLGWDYMIAHYSKLNEWAIMRVSEDDVQWLSSNEQWTRESKLAKRFYHQNTAEGALVIYKIKGLKEENLMQKEVKQSWGEL